MHLPEHIGTIIGWIVGGITIVAALFSVVKRAVSLRQEIVDNTRNVENLTKKVDENFTKVKEDIENTQTTMHARCNRIEQQITEHNAQMVSLMNTLIQKG